MGFQTGINLSALNGDKDYNENKLRVGLSAYVFADIPLGYQNIVSIETGLAYSQQGMNHTLITNDISSTHTRNIKNKLDYIILPIYLKENLTNFYTKLGPYGAYLINVESSWKEVEERPGQVLNDTIGTNDEFIANVNDYDFGLSFGFGYIHYFDNVRRIRRRRGKRVIPVLQVDFKYNLGLMCIDKSGNVPNMNLRNRTFMIGLSISTVYNR
jgi:hypothetical protein